MKAKRVMLVGNANAQLVRQAAYVKELGAEVMVASNGAQALEHFAGYRYHRILSYEELRPAEEGVEARATAEADALAAAIKAFAPDLTHALGMGMNFAMVARTKVRPLAVSAHGFLEHWVYGDGKLTKEDKLLAHADMLLVEPPCMVEIGQRLLPATTRVVESAIGLDGRYFRPATPAQRMTWRRALQIPPEATLILSPRGWNAVYHHDLILTAFAQALPHLPAPAYLGFVRLRRTWQAHKTEELIEQVRQRAQDLGVAEQVRWLPFFPEVTIATLYNAADLVVSYCYPDALPMSLLEALACERPVVAPDLPTFAGSVLATHCRLTPCDDVDALAAAMVAAINTPPSPIALTTARQAVLARYDKPQVMAQIETLYDSLVAA